MLGHSSEPIRKIESVSFFHPNTKQSHNHLCKQHPTNSYISTMPRCNGTTRAGTRCKLNTSDPSGFCSQHGKPSMDIVVDDTPLTPLDMEIAALTARLKELKVARRRSRSQSRVETMAKRLHYHDAKNRPDILEVLNRCLAALPFLQPTARPPWQLVKKATDFLFSELTPEDREVYMEKARKALVDA